MSIERKLIGTVDASSGPAVYVEDVFSTWLYNGTGSSQTITNGIDLATKGGLVWVKIRDGDYNQCLIDTAQGTSKVLFSNRTDGVTSTTGDVTAFNTTGFTVGTNGRVNQNISISGIGKFTSWTFAKQAKFFDVVTYTGTGSARTISHALGATPGMIIVKRLNSTGGWITYHKSLGATHWIALNSTGSSNASIGYWNNTSPTSSQFTLGNDLEVNGSGSTYVAYLFADSNSGGFGPAGTDSVVACGSFTASSLTSVSLGWEPQFVLLKKSTSVSDWFLSDTMRGLDQTNSRLLMANASAQEFSNPTPIIPTATGFNYIGTNFNDTSGTYIYLAIRRGPMRTPTDATKVYNTATLGATAGPPGFTAGFPVDMAIWRQTNATDGNTITTRLLEATNLQTNTTSAGGPSSLARYDYQGGWYNSSTLSSSYRSWMFRRAPGFFDVVCYTGTGSATTVAHNLGVAPELMIVKARGSSGWNWAVYSTSRGNTKAILLNDTGSEYTGIGWWNNTSPTSSVFTVGTMPDVNNNGTTFVAYLFATCPGVSKCGSYTGNGSSQTIDCGFASGARFVLIKRTDAAGDWYVWDTARGIVSGNDPRLSLNTTAAEVTTDDSIDPASSGFIVNQRSATNINVSSATYIYLAIA